jgi:D-3-phosphoglycerate dehydrogenase
VRQPVILIAEKVPRATVAVLAPCMEVRHCDGTNRAELLAAVAEVDALVVHRTTRVDAEVIAAARRLSVIGNVGQGPGPVDVAEAARAGVMVVSALNARCVSRSELTVGLLVSAARSGQTGVRLEEKVLGIIGWCRTSTMVAVRMHTFGMRIIAWDPRRPRHMRPEVTLVSSLEELLAEADFVTVHRPGTGDTEGFIDATALRRVKPAVRVVHVGAGRAVDEQALIAAVEEGRVAVGIGIHVHDPPSDDVAVAQSVRDTLATEPDATCTASPR